MNVDETHAKITEEDKMVLTKASYYPDLILSNTSKNNCNAKII